VSTIIIIIPGHVDQGQGSIVEGPEFGAGTALSAAPTVDTVTST